MAAISSSILRTEAEAREETRRRGFDVEGWEQVAPEDATRFWALLRSAALLADPSLPPEVRASARQCTPPSLRCTSTTHLAMIYAVMGELATPEESAEVEAALGESLPCDLGLARALWSTDVNRASVPDLARLFGAREFKNRRRRAMEGLVMVESLARTFEEVRTGQREEPTVQVAEP